MSKSPPVDNPCTIDHMRRDEWCVRFGSAYFRWAGAVAMV